MDRKIHIRDRDRPISEKARPFRSVTWCPQGVWAPGFYTQTRESSIGNQLQLDLTGRKQIN